MKVALDLMEELVEVEFLSELVEQSQLILVQVQKGPFGFLYMRQLEMVVVDGAGHERVDGGEALRFLGFRIVRVAERGKDISFVGRHGVLVHLVHLLDVFTIVITFRVQVSSVIATTSIFIVALVKLLPGH